MQFYDATNKRAICQEIDRLCDTDDNSYPRLDKTARVNDALEELVGKIITADGTWQYDDTNYTTVPRGTGNLVEGQQSYTFAAEYLEITSVEVQITTAGIWTRLIDINKDDLEGRTTEEFFGITSGNPTKGLPRYYSIEGDSIRLFPAPTSTAVTLSGGIRISFKRTAQLFTAASDTSADTTEPGLPSPYHVLLSYMASVPHCITYKKDRVPLLEGRVLAMTKDLIAFFGHRERDRRKVMTMKEERYI